MEEGRRAPKKPTQAYYQPPAARFNHVGSVQFNYQYKLRTQTRTEEGKWDGEGKILNPETNVVLDCSTLGETAPAHKEFAYHCTHGSWLRCYLVDNSNGYLLHQSFNETLQQWLKRTCHTGVTHYIIPRLKKSNISSSPVIWFVPENLRKVIKDIVSFLIFLHKKNKSAGKFSMHELVMVGDEVKFWRLTFDDSSRFNNNRDFGCLSQILQSIFPVETTPYDMKNFMEILGDNAACDMEDLIFHHTALLSHKEREIFLKDCWTIRRSLLSAESYAYRKSVSQFSYDPQWRDLIDDESLGPLWLTYEESKQRDNNFGIQNEVDSRRPPTPDAEKLTLIRTWRNITEHLSSNGQLCDSTLNHCAVELMVMHVFGEKIVEFQKLLWENQIISLFFR